MGSAESSVFYRDIDADECGTVRRQPPKHLPESASYRRLDTPKLLDDLSKTFENWQEIIINMRTNQMPEHDAQEYLYRVMIETRDKLDKIMVSTKWCHLKSSNFQYLFWTASRTNLLLTTVIKGFISKLVPSLTLKQSERPALH